MDKPLTGTVAVNGATLGYTVQGTGPLVLVLGSSVYYPRTFSQRLTESCRMAFLDMRHFAKRSSASALDGVTLDSYIDDIEDACVSLGLDHFVLLGHSHHGNLALEYAKRHSTRVSHLGLLGTPPCNVQHTIEAGRRYWSDHASRERKTALRRNWETFDSLHHASLKERFVAEYVADGPKYWDDPDFDASWLWKDVPVNLDLVEEFRSFFTDYEFSLHPVALTTPVLVVTGRHDYAVPPVLWNGEFTDFSNTSYHLFEHSGHTPQLEEPELFDRIFLEWLERNSPCLL